MNKREYSVEEFSAMSDVELARTKSFLRTLLVLWTRFCPPLEAVQLNRELGYDSLATTILAKHLRLSRIIKAAKETIGLIEEEQQRRGVL